MYYVCAVSVVITLTLTVGLINIFTARFLQILDGAELHFAGVPYNRSMSGHGRTRLSQGDKSFAVVDGRLMTETGVAETTYMRYF